MFSLFCWYITFDIYDRNYSLIILNWTHQHTLHETVYSTSNFINDVTQFKTFFLVTSLTFFTFLQLSSILVPKYAINLSLKGWRQLSKVLSEGLILLIFVRLLGHVPGLHHLQLHDRQHHPLDHWNAAPETDLRTRAQMSSSWKLRAGDNPIKLKLF